MQDGELLDQDEQCLVYVGVHGKLTPPADVREDLSEMNFACYGQLANKTIVIKEQFTYVGIIFQTTHRNIFVGHYMNKASKARVIGHAILGVESMVGRLPPAEGRKLYMGHIDPHLTGGCEIAIDVDPP